MEGHIRNKPSPERKGQQGNSTLVLVGRRSNSLFDFVSGGDHHAGVWSEVQLQCGPEKLNQGIHCIFNFYLLCSGV